MPKVMCVCLKRTRVGEDDGEDVRASEPRRRSLRRRKERTMETSSSRMLNSFARFSKSARILDETCTSHLDLRQFTKPLLPFGSTKESATHEFTLLDELGGVVLSDDGLEDLVPDRGQDALVVVESEVLVDLREVLDVWAGENSKGDRDHLEILREEKDGKRVSRGAFGR